MIMVIKMLMILEPKAIISYMGKLRFIKLKSFSEGFRKNFWKRQD